jgi:O-antigen ligase
MKHKNTLNFELQKNSKFFWGLICIITFVFIINMLDFYSNVLDWGLPLTILNQISLLLLGLISIMGFAFFIFEKKMHYINIVLIVLAIISVLSTLFNYHIYGDSLQNSLFYQVVWISVFVIVYYESRKTETISMINLVNSTFPLIALTFFIVYFSYAKVMNISGINLVYYLQMLLPFILCIKRYKIKTICLMVISIAIILSLKRMAIIAFLFALLVFFIIDFYVKGKRRVRKYYLTLAALIVFIVGVFFYNQVVGTFDLEIMARLQMLDTDGGSGRDIIYQSIWETLLNSTLGEWILGHGYNAVSLTSAAGLYSAEFISSAAHNDFLEVIYNYGILGFIFYIILWIKLIILAVKLIDVKSEMAAPFAASLILFFLFSLFSILILYPRYFIYLVIFWAICFGDYQKTLKRIE